MRRRSFAQHFDPPPTVLETVKARRSPMAAVQETVDRVRSIEVEAYKYGFVTDIESDKAPKGLNEDIVRFISAKKGEPRMAARMAARGLSPLADDGRAALGAGRISPRSTTRTSTITPRRNRRRGRSRSTRSIPSCCAPTPSSAFRWSNRRSWPASSGRGSRSTRSSTRFRSPPPSRPSSPRRA